MPAGIHPAGFDEVRHAGIGELAVGEGRAEVAESAVAPADEEAKAALGGSRVAGLAGRIALGQGVAEVVERGAAGDLGLQERGERLAEIDEYPFVVRAGRYAERAPVAAGELLVGAGSAAPRRRGRRPFRAGRAVAAGFAPTASPARRPSRTSG